MGECAGFCCPCPHGVPEGSHATPTFMSYVPVPHLRPRLDLDLMNLSVEQNGHDGKCQCGVAGRQGLLPRWETREAKPALPLLAVQTKQPQEQTVSQKDGMEGRKVAQARRAPHLFPAEHSCQRARQRLCPRRPGQLQCCISSLPSSLAPSRHIQQHCWSPPISGCIRPTGTHRAAHKRG